MPLVGPDSIPRGREDIDARWLERITGEEVKGPLELTEIATTSFSHVVELKAEPRRWVVKWSRHDRAHPDLERGHEILFYDQVAPSLPAAALAPAVAWAYDPDRAAVMIVFRSLEGYDRQEPSHLPPPAAICHRMVDSLAIIHAARWSNPPLAVLGLSLPDQNELETRTLQVADRVSRFKQARSDTVGGDVVRILDRVIEQFPGLLPRLQDPTGMSVVHDDVHIGNFLIPISGGSARIVDWQTWISDLAIRDLAHMIAYFWFPSARRDLEEPLLRRYREQLALHGIDYPWDALWHDYRLSVTRKVLHAVWEWDMGANDWKWYSHLMRVSMAYDDLGCSEL